MCDFIYLCPECGNCFSSETSLQEHNVAAHSSQGIVCYLCRKVLKDIGLLKSHVIAHQNLLHCCNICGELCENMVDVYVHVTTSHKYEGKIVCDLCSKTFSTSFSLKVHSINNHGMEMPRVLQKWELFCNVHSSRNLCRSDALKDSFYPSDDCPLHPKEKESRDETNSAPVSDASTSNQSILLSEKMDDTERQRGCQRSAFAELQIFLQEQGDKESWYTKSADHLSCSIRPSDIIERIQSLNDNKKTLHKNQPTCECRLCETTFSNRKDHLLAHDAKDPSNVYSHKQEEKPALQTEIQDLVEFRKSITGKGSHASSTKCVKEQLSGIETAVIRQDKTTSVENQNEQSEPNDSLLSEISALTI